MLISIEGFKRVKEVVYMIDSSPPKNSLRNRWSMSVPFMKDPLVKT